MPLWPLDDWKWLNGLAPFLGSTVGAFSHIFCLVPANHSEMTHNSGPEDRHGQQPTVCIVYDCLFPFTIGGAERWYRALANALVADGFSTTYLTRRQWDTLPDDLANLEVVPVSGRGDLYNPTGTRRLLPTLRFAWGVFRYLVRHRTSFNVIHLANFPFFPVLAARLALVGSPTVMAVDWHEVWSSAYWRRYAGPFLGSGGFLVQRACIAAAPIAFVFSSRNAQLLTAAGAPQEPIVLAGLLPEAKPRICTVRPPVSPGLPPVVLFAGRHIADKGVDLLPDVFEAARRFAPDLHMVVVGDGPLRRDVERKMHKLGLQNFAHFLGFVDDEVLNRLVEEASCVLLPSRREGYGMLVVEAASHGTPAVVARHLENAAVDLIEQGRNGFTVDPGSIAGLALAVVECLSRGVELRRTTSEWFAERAPHMTMNQGVSQVIAFHRQLVRLQPDDSGASSRGEGK